MSTIWTAEEIPRIGYRVVDLIANHLTALPDEPLAGSGAHGTVRTIGRELTA
jgi:hypothetical protein